MKIELGGMRMDEVLVSVLSYRDRLRIAVARMQELNKSIFVTTSTIYVHELLVDMLGACENATEALLAAEARGEPEASMGPVHRVSDGEPWDR